MLYRGTKPDHAGCDRRRRLHRRCRLDCHQGCPAGHGRRWQSRPCTRNRCLASGPMPASFLPMTLQGARTWSTASASRMQGPDRASRRSVERRADHRQLRHRHNTTAGCNGAAAMSRRPCSPIAQRKSARSRSGVIVAVGSRWLPSLQHFVRATVSLPGQGSGRRNDVTSPWRLGPHSAPQRSNPDGDRCLRHRASVGQCAQSSDLLSMLARSRWRACDGAIHFASLPRRGSRRVSHRQRALGARHEFARRRRRSTSWVWR